MIIYKKDNSVRITIHQSDNSDVKYEISAEEYANVNIKSLDPIAFDTGDYVTLFGQRFTLYKAASIIEKFSSEHFEYTLKFESLRADLASINFVLFDNTTDGTEPGWSAATTYEFSQKVKYNNVVYKYINPVPSAGHATSDADYWAVVRTAPIWDFPIVLDPKRYAQMVVDNINRARPNEAWTVGFAIDHTPMQATFSNTNCLDALGTISGIFETEFWIGNYTVNIGKRATTTSLTMQYGSEGGFRNITRTEVSNTKKVTRLVALGSDRNLQGTYRNGSPRLMLPTNYYIDSANIDVNNPKEETVTWDDIYPCMEHAKEDYSSSATYSLGAQVLYNRISWDYINATPSAGHTPSSGAYWKISEGTVLSAISTLKFSDENLTFNPLDSTYAMTDGTKPKVAFLTGNLAGYEFPISNFDPLTKTITLETIEDGTDNILPAKDYGFAYGDQYFFVDLYMPQSYITKAENRLLAKATEYLEKYSKDQISYRGDVSTIWATANSVNLAIGDLITVIDTDFGINDAYRIINLTRNITNTYKYSIELSQLPYIPSRIESIENSINDNQNQIDRNGSDKQMFKVNTYRGAKEAIDMAFDPEGNYFTDKIKPLIVETSQILIGTSSQQYALTGLVFSTLSSDPNTVSWTAGTITDSTMETSPRAWNIAAGTFVADADPLKSYYCYIVCPRATGSVDATISFSEAQILVKQDNTNYYFLFGTLGKLIDGIRQLWTSKGFTFISGDTIVTGRIKNTDGTVDINLTEGKMVIGGGTQSLQYNVDGDGKLKITGTIEAVAGLIAGWTIGTDTISKGNVVLGADGSISNVIDGVVYWTLNPDGSGSVGRGGITWNAAGEINGSFTTLENVGDFNVDGSIFASGAVVAGALNGTLPDDLPVSSPSLYGVTKYDNLTIKANANGQLYVTSSGGTVVAWGTEVAGQSVQLAVAAVNKTLALAGHTHNYQPLDNDLTAIAALTGTGLLKRTGTDTWTFDTNAYLTAITKEMVEAVLTETISSHWHPFISISDTRSNEYLPYETAIKQGIHGPNLKLNTTDGLSDGGMYHSSIYIHPWGDNSGGAGHNLAFTDNGNMYFRSGLTAWCEWKKMWHSVNSNLKTIDWYAKNLYGVNGLFDGAVVAGALNGTLPDDLPVATSLLYGVVKFDPTTLALNGSNQLTVIGGGGGSDVTWGTPTAQYTPLTVDAVTRNLSVDGHTHSQYLTAISKTMVENVLIGNITTHWHDYLPLSGGIMTGSISFNDYATNIQMPIGNIGCNDGDSYFWNLNNFPIKFGTNNIERLRIKENGYIGVGTPSPSYKLHVHDTIQNGIYVSSVSPNVVLGNNETFTSKTFNSVFGLSTSVGNFLANSEIGDTVVASKTNILFGTGILAGVENGTIRMSIKTNGNVLIGTTTDSGYKLDVNGTGRYSDRLTLKGGLSVIGTNVNSYTTALLIGNTVSRTYYLGAGIPLTYEDGFSLIDYTNNIKLMYVDPNGNFTIGVNSGDGYKLDVKGTLRAVGAAYLNSTLSVTGASTFTGLLTANGGINATTGTFSSYVTANRFYTGYDAGLANSFSCSNWFRSNGASGWYNDTYGAGILSDTANIVRTYSTNKFKVYNTAIDSILTLGGVTAANVVSSGAVVAGALNGTLPDDLPIATTALFGVSKYSGLAIQPTAGDVALRTKHYTSPTANTWYNKAYTITYEIGFSSPGSLAAGAYYSSLYLYALPTAKCLACNITVIPYATGTTPPWIGQQLIASAAKDSTGYWRVFIYNPTASAVDLTNVKLSIIAQMIE